MKFKKSNKLKTWRLALTVVISIIAFAMVAPSTRTDAMAEFGMHSTYADSFANGVFPLPASFNGPGKFRFINPITSNPPDPKANFDAELLTYLTVRVCRLEAPGCVPVTAFTSQGSMSTQLRIESKPKDGSYYIVNWDTSGTRMINTATYRVSVDAAGISLGYIDLPPAVYNPWGRTWPIKFIIEKDPVLRIQVLAASGSSIWEVADDLRTELGLCDDVLGQLLLDNYPNADADQVTEVVNGVCQEVVLQPNTRIVDKETRNALASYDMSSGRMVFVGDTALLKSLQINHVIVSRQGPAAPYGYLRKITSVRKSKGIYTLETVQAKFTEAIQVGTLQVSGPLEPNGSSNASARNKLLSANSLNSFGDTIDIGNQIPFEKHIDVEINLDGGDDEIGGTGTVRVVGDIEIRAGYNIGAGIELCTTPPFACADRVEAWMGFVHKSNLRVIGKFDGHLHKEFPYPIPMSPIFFMIGPVPVWLVPQVNVIVGFDGTAHVDFEFATQAQSNVKPYIKWTDDGGWTNLTTIAPLSDTFFDARFDGDAHLEGYAKLDAALLLYGAIGPSMDGSLGIVGDAQTGQSPFWKISGHVKAGIGLRSAFTELFDIGAHEDFLDETFTIKEADRLPPQFSNVRTGRIPVDVGDPVFLGPRTSSQSFLGFYEVSDPDGSGPLNIVATVDGVDVGLNPTFTTPGLRTVMITATDSDNLSNSIYLAIDVRNSVPIVTVTAQTDVVAAGDQFFVNAYAYDPEDGFLPCSSVKWSVVDNSPPATITRSSNPLSCKAVVIFDQQGIGRVRATATDSLGDSFSGDVTVIVNPASGNRAPIIELDSFKVYAESGPRTVITGSCPLGIFCEVPDVPPALLFNGQAGDFHPPLYMEINVTDPEGDPFDIEWVCKTGNTLAPIIYTADGWPSCIPEYSPNEPIQVYALIFTPIGLGSDSRTLLAVSEVKTYAMLQRTN